MAHVIHAGSRSQGEVNDDDEYQAGQDRVPLTRRHGDVTELEAGEYCTSNAEYRTGCADFQTLWGVRDTEQRSAHSRQQIDHRGLPTSKQPLGEPSQGPKPPHVESKVKEASVDEAGSYQPPIITADRQSAKICPPLDQLLTAEPSDR